VQLRALVLQIAFVSVTRCVQSMDATGTAAAAHAVTVTVWQVTPNQVLTTLRIALKGQKN
jgi:hypothetical protein